MEHLTRVRFGHADHALFQQQSAVVAALPDLPRLHGALSRIAENPDMPCGDYVSLSATVLEFRTPSDFGTRRRYWILNSFVGVWGNGKLDCEVVSVCLSEHRWNEARDLLEHDATKLTRALKCEIADVEYESVLANHDRVLVLWDAHGFDVAEIVLSTIVLCTTCATPGTLDFGARSGIGFYSATHSIKSSPFVPSILSHLDGICYWYYFSVSADAAYFPEPSARADEGS